MSVLSDWKRLEGKTILAIDVSDGLLDGRYSEKRISVSFTDGDSVSLNIPHESFGSTAPVEVTAWLR